MFHTTWLLRNAKFYWFHSYKHLACDVAKPSLKDS